MFRPAPLASSVEPIGVVCSCWARLVCARARWKDIEKKVGSRVADGQLVTIEVTSCVYLQWAVSLELFSHQESQILPLARKIFPIGLKRLPQPTTFIISSRMGKHPHPQIFREENDGLHHFPERPSLSFKQTRDAGSAKRRIGDFTVQQTKKFLDSDLNRTFCHLTSPVRFVPPHRTRG